MLPETRALPKKGFTLIEILIVISILGLLSAWIFPNFTTSLARSRDSKRRLDLQAVSKALQAYYNDHQNYPNDDDVGCIKVASNAYCWGEAFIVGPSGNQDNYMTKLPQDPKSSLSYYYEVVEPGTGYVLEACLERPGPEDNDLCGVINNCPIPPDRSDAVCYHP
jgi:type II secretion system protein G